MQTCFLPALSSPYTECADYGVLSIKNVSGCNTKAGCTLTACCPKASTAETCGRYANQATGTKSCDGDSKLKQSYRDIATTKDGANFATVCCELKTCKTWSTGGETCKTAGKVPGNLATGVKKSEFDSKCCVDETCGTATDAIWNMPIADACKQFGLEMLAADTKKNSVADCCKDYATSKSCGKYILASRTKKTDPPKACADSDSTYDMPKLTTGTITTDGEFDAGCCKKRSTCGEIALSQSNTKGEKCADATKKTFYGKDVNKSLTDKTKFDATCCTVSTCELHKAQGMKCGSGKIYKATAKAELVDSANAWDSKCCMKEVDCPYVPTPAPTPRPTTAAAGGKTTTSTNATAAAPRAAAAGLAGSLAAVLCGLF